MKNIIQKMQDKTTGKSVLVLFILTMAIYTFMLTVSIPKVESYAGGLALFDLSPGGYSLEDANARLAALGPTGSNAYLYQQLPFDFIYPGLFAVSYTLMLVWLFLKRFPTDAHIYYLAFVPALGGLFDYLENICIVLMINTYPALSKGLVAAASTFSILKSILTTLFFVLLFVALGMLVFRKKPAVESNQGLAM